MKIIGYYLFAILYYIGCLFPVKKNRFFCVMTHDGSDDSSVGVVVKAIKNKDNNASFIFVKKGDKKSTGMISLFLKKPFGLATSSTILMDNEFLPLAYIKIRRNVKVVQLWHGTGTIKKFGHDISEGKMLSLLKRADNRITHLIVNSEYTGNLYQKTFGVSRDKVYITGIPRTDIMFDNAVLKSNLEKLYTDYSVLRNKRIILYAPTFRDDEIHDPKVNIDLDMWNNEFDEKTVLILKLHPFVAAAFDSSELEKYSSHIIDMSMYSDLNTLMFASDALITDYSSIVFEYVLLNRPVYFYAYDYDKFTNESRGFYEDYNEFVPGEIVKTTRELIDCINSEDLFSQKRKKFVNTYYKYTDGKSIQRFLDLL